MADYSATLRSPAGAVLRAGVTPDSVSATARGTISAAYYKMIADRFGGGAPVVWVVQGSPDSAGASAPAAIVAGTARVAGSSNA